VLDRQMGEAGAITTTVLGDEDVRMCIVQLGSAQKS
jgi:hypothetical protein